MTSSRQNGLLTIVVTCAWTCLALSGCFDWDVPDNYRPISPDGDADGDVDGDADGDAGHGEICAAQEDCADGHICTDDEGDLFRLCRRHCVGLDGCHGLGPNSICANWWNGFTESACTVNCDPVWPDADCPPDTHCQIVFMDAAFATTCWQEMGPTMEFAPCDSAMDCGYGYHCIEHPALPVEPHCVQACWNIGEPCEDLPLRCMGTEYFLLDGTELGICAPLP